jgi:membrane-bound metal-dependent hydrolase YbcI (DUF457 family)
LLATVEPFAHAFTSLALSRAGQRRLPRFGTAMLVVSGLAPDLDYASYAGGPEAFMRFHRSALHSIAGAALLAAVIAAAFCALDRKLPAKKNVQTRTFPPLAFGIACAVCAVGVAGHLLLDLASGVGVQLLWPFRSHWYGWDLAGNFDPWILVLLVLGLLVPLLFKLVNEEVTSGKKTATGDRAAVAVLVLLVAYLGARAHYHGEAVDLLLSREYHGRVALSAEAFPESVTMFAWRGLAVTDNTIEEVDVPLGPGEFDSDRSVTHYKPEESPALEVGQKTAATARFLDYARVPFASVRRVEADYRFEVHDFRFEPGDSDPANVFVRVDMDSQFHIRREKFLFASSPND